MPSKIISISYVLHPQVHLLLVELFQKTHKPSLNMRKEQTNSTETYLKKYLTNALQKHQGHEKQEKTQKWSQAGEDED